jgi:hypothetical protein
VESPLRYRPACAGILTKVRYPDLGPRLVGSLTGAVASQKVTEAPQGLLSVVGHHTSSARAQGGLTARLTGRAGTKVGPSDPHVASGSAWAKRLKGTPGITGLFRPSVHSDGGAWHLNIWGVASEMTQVVSAYNGGTLPVIRQRATPWEVCREI